MFYSTALDPVVHIEPQLLNLTVNAGENAIFYCSATGVGSSYFKYQWFLNREPIEDQSTATLNIDAVSVYKTGNYTCSVLSPYGAISQSNNTITLILRGNCLYGTAHTQIYNCTCVTFMHLTKTCEM